MSVEVFSEIPTQKKMINSINKIPIEYFEWGNYPDHFKIDMPHRHEFSELLFFTRGGGIHEIGFKEYEIKSCSVHYIPKSTVHFLKRNPLSDGFTIAFDATYFEKNNIHKFISPIELEPFTLNLPSADFKSILDQTNIILKSIKQNRGYYRQKCFLVCLELLLNTIASARSEQSKMQTTEYSELVRDFNYLVRTNIHHHNKVKWYAQRLNLSPKYLSQQIKKETGLSAKKYILKALLASVKRELINTSKSIKQIAFGHQYDESTLGKFFKKQVGYTMNAYRSYDQKEK